MNNLTQDLAVLETDLRNENWQPVISAFSADSPEAMREVLHAVYSQRPFAGIFLIGDFPYPRMWSYPAEYPDQPGAADYFYMDMDGGWSDANGDGFYDVHSDGPGDRQPEVFVGRLNAGNVPGLGRSELELVRDYLRRDHAYRTGKLATRKAALYATYKHTLYGWVGAENAEWT
ncbi:MAG: C25 family cysteine peptidase, partial [Anaerolineales bacterium]